MNEILKDRVILIRAMMNAVKDLQPNISSNQFNTIENIISNIRADDQNHFLSLSIDKSISTINIAQVNVSFARVAENKLIVKGRPMTSLGRYFSKYYSRYFDVITDSLLDKFVKRTAVHLNKSSIVQLNSMVKILRGKDIRDFYRTTGESQTHSCMTGKCSAYKVMIYELNPDKVGLAVLQGSARALVWTCDDGTKVLDRVYPAGSNMVDMIRLWGESNGYALRKVTDSNVVDSTIEFMDDSDKQVTLKHNGIFPFFDTFRYGKFLSNNNVVISNNINFGTVKFSTDQGSFVEVMRCFRCGDRRGKPREVFIDNEIDTVNICDTCYKNLYVVCNNCNKSVPEKKVVIHSGSNKWGRSYCKKCAIAMQKFMEFNDCKCDACSESKQYYVELFKHVHIKDNMLESLQEEYIDVL